MKGGVVVDFLLLIRYGLHYYYYYYYYYFTITTTTTYLYSISLPRANVMVSSFPWRAMKGRE